MKFNYNHFQNRKLEFNIFQTVNSEWFRVISCCNQEQRQHHQDYPQILRWHYGWERKKTGTLLAHCRSHAQNLIAVHVCSDPLLIRVTPAWEEHKEEKTASTAHTGNTVWRRRRGREWKRGRRNGNGQSKRGGRAAWWLQRHIRVMSTFHLLSQHLKVLCTQSVNIHLYDCVQTSRATNPNYFQNDLQRQDEQGVLKQMVWSPQSPDLSVTESVWDHIKSRGTPCARFSKMLQQLVNRWTDADLKHLFTAICFFVFQFLFLIWSKYQHQQNISKYNTSLPHGSKNWLMWLWRAENAVFFPAPLLCALS